MDICMVDVTSERVNENIWKGHVSSTPWPEKNSVCQIWTFVRMIKPKISISMYCINLLGLFGQKYVQ